MPAGIGGKFSWPRYIQWQRIDHTQLSFEGGLRQQTCSRTATLYVQQPYVGNFRG